MKDELLGYYERELTYLRRAGAEFAEKYPKIASRLVLEAARCADPHVERLLEGFAFLAARIHRKLDDELPEATGALLGILYPELLAPLPSMSVVEIALDPEQGCPTTGVLVPRHTPLFSKPVQGTPCRFRTAYPVLLWPLEVVGAGLERSSRKVEGRTARSALRLRLRCLAGLRFSDLECSSLRFHLHGEGRLVHRLYELLFANAAGGEFASAGGSGGGASAPAILGPATVEPVGFGFEEGLLPTSSRTFLGYRLLQEYFAFPEKFLFFDLRGLDAVRGSAAGEELDVLLFFDADPGLDEEIDPGTFRLGCTPVVNLFPQVAEPIALTRRRFEYDVVPDARRRFATEVYAIESVRSAKPSVEETREYRPFYSFRHGDDPRRPQPYWYATRRSSERKGDAGTEVSIAFVDRGFRPDVSDEETVVVSCLCTNRDLPARLPFGSDDDFQAEGVPSIRAVRSLRMPTPSLRYPYGRGAEWHLVDLLALNHLSLAERDGEALRGLLRALDATGSAATAQQIEGIVRVESRPVVRPVSGGTVSGFCRGTEASLLFDEERFVGTGVFLLASVLERFFALYATLNSFTQTVVRSRQREGTLHRWPPRLGEQALL